MCSKCQPPKKECHEHKHECCKKECHEHKHEHECCKKRCCKKRCCEQKHCYKHCQKCCCVPMPIMYENPPFDNMGVSGSFSSGPFLTLSYGIVY